MIERGITVRLLRRSHSLGFGPEFSQQPLLLLGEIDEGGTLRIPARDAGATVALDMGANAVLAVFEYRFRPVAASVKRSDPDESCSVGFRHGVHDFVSRIAEPEAFPQ